MQSTRSKADPRSLRRASVIAVIAIALFAAGTFAESVFPRRDPSGTLIYLAVAAGLGIAYTVFPFIRDDAETLIVWPGVMFALAAAGLWTLLGVADSSWVAVLALTVGFLLLLAMIFLGAALVLSPKTDRLGLIHPILLKAVLDTEPSDDRPMLLTVRVDQPEFPEWVRLAAFLREERLVDSVRVRRNRVTIRMTRVAGLPRVWSYLLFPFGLTTLRVDSRGLGIVSVDDHVYRLLERPGPYIRYCYNIVNAFSRMAAFISEGRLEDAKLVAERSPSAVSSKVVSHSF